jgi:hypothetical protein
MGVSCYWLFFLISHISTNVSLSLINLLQCKPFSQCKSLYNSFETKYILMWLNGECTNFKYTSWVLYEGISKHSHTCYQDWKWQIVQLSATRCHSIAIFWVSLLSFVGIALCISSQRMLNVVCVKCNPRLFLNFRDILEMTRWEVCCLVSGP